MNRYEEIKFRAWDKVGKKIWMPDAITADGRNIALINEFGVQVPDPQGDPIMQFTGLKDKNGKEIFEGDIVKWRSHPNPMKQGQVIWANCAFIIVWFNNELERERNYHSTKQLGGHLNSIEVIGNIYENPELLK